VTEADGSAVGKLSVELVKDQRDEEEEENFPMELLGRTLREEEQFERSEAKRARAARERSCRRMRSG
jgi:hypothetical protein